MHLTDQTKEHVHFSLSSQLNESVKQYTAEREHRRLQTKLPDDSGMPCPTTNAYLREYTKSQLYFTNLLKA